MIDFDFTGLGTFKPSNMREPRQLAGKGNHPVYNLRVREKHIAGGMTPWERKFKMAACELVLEHIYPSGRQILRRALGGGHPRLGNPNLNGRECRWKAQVFNLFNLETSYYGMKDR